MEFIYQILPFDVLHALGWTVVHSLWQAFVVALLLAAYLLGLQKTDARKRYIAGNVGLVITLLLSAFTFCYYLEKSQPEVELVSELAMMGGSSSEADIDGSGEAFFNAYFMEHMPLIVTIWLVGLVIFMLRMMGGLLYIQRLKTRMTAPLPRFWQEKMLALANELRIAQPVQLLETALVQAPMVVGWLKPVILLPLGAVNNLTPAQVEAILAHELAHIMRHDYLLNLLQSCVEILFYFNPAVWWISASVRTERENCCDDIAVRLCGSSLAYAKALVSLQEMQLASPALALPFSKNKNQLLFRIKRILQPSQNKSNVMEKLSATLLLTVAVVLLSVQANTPFGDFINKVVSKGLPVKEAIAPEIHEDDWAEADTIPDGTRDAHIHYNSDEEEIEFEMKDDEITFLKIGGKVIPAEQYSEYEEQVREILASVPEPPRMPDFPDMPNLSDFPDMPAMPAPPAPPSFEGMPARPAPPARPTRTRKITTQKDGRGMTFIIENEDGGEPVEIVVQDGKKGTIIVNGQEITGLKKGGKTIILQDVPGGDFHWNGDAFAPGNFHYEFPAMAEVPHFSFNDDFNFDTHKLMAELEYLKDAKLMNEDMVQEWQLAAKERAHSDEWRMMSEEELAAMEERLAELREQRYELTQEQREEIERAMEVTRETHRDAMKKFEKESKEKQKAEQKAAKRRSGSM